MDSFQTEAWPAFAELVAVRAAKFQRSCYPLKKALIKKKKLGKELFHARFAFKNTLLSCISPLAFDILGH